jgi:hypothetical protein
MNADERRLRKRLRSEIRVHLRSSAANKLFLSNLERMVVPCACVLTHGDCGSSVRMLTHGGSACPWHVDTEPRPSRKPLQEAAFLRLKGRHNFFVGAVLNPLSRAGDKTGHIRNRKTDSMQIAPGRHAR